MRDKSDPPLKEEKAEPEDLKKTAAASTQNASLGLDESKKVTSLEEPQDKTTNKVETKKEAQAPKPVPSKSESSPTASDDKEDQSKISPLIDLIDLLIKANFASDIRAGIIAIPSLMKDANKRLEKFGDEVFNPGVEKLGKLSHNFLDPINEKLAKGEEYFKNKLLSAAPPDTATSSTEEIELTEFEPTTPEKKATEPKKKGEELDAETPDLNP